MWFGLVVSYVGLSEMFALTVTRVVVAVPSDHADRTPTPAILALQGGRGDSRCCGVI